MSMLDDLTEYLNKDVNEDCWSDYGVDRAQEMLAALADPEWDRLVQEFTRHSHRWQRRLADALFGATHPTSIVILEAMLGSGESSIALAAAESLEATSNWAPRRELEQPKA